MKWLRILSIMIICFILCVSLLYIFEPSVILKINDQNEEVIDWAVLILYSLTLSFVLGTCIYISSLKNEDMYIPTTLGENPEIR